MFVCVFVLGFVWFGLLLLFLNLLNLCVGCVYLLSMSADVCGC